MASAKKCDRCGKFYDVYNSANSNKKINSLIRANTDGKRQYFAQEIIELCPECMNVFEVWLKNEGEKNDR